MIDDLKPRREQPVQLRQDQAVAAVDLDRELVADGAKERSILPFVVAALGLAWTSSTPSTAPTRTTCEDTKRRSAIDQHRVRDPAMRQPPQLTHLVDDRQRPVPAAASSAQYASTNRTSGPVTRTHTKTSILLTVSTLLHGMAITASCSRTRSTKHSGNDFD
ncbi:MAG TPA: hypothetical protein VF526_21495 [Solirubrobacteraceae bacterium]|jgi:hypothetical protein